MIGISILGWQTTMGVCDWPESTHARRAFTPNNPSIPQSSGSWEFAMQLHWKGVTYGASDR